MKSEYTVALDRLRELKTAEVEAEDDAGRSARSVEILAAQVSSATKELDGLQNKVDERLRKHVDVREILIAQKEEIIKGNFQNVFLDFKYTFLPFLIRGLQDRLDRRQQEFSDVERRLRDQLEELEKNQSEKEEAIEARERKLRLAEMEVESEKRRSKTETEVQKRREKDEKRKMEVSS